MGGTREALREWAATPVARNVGHVVAFVALLLAVPQVCTLYLGLLLETRRGVLLGAVATLGLAAVVVGFGYLPDPASTLARVAAFLDELRRDMAVVNATTLVAAFVAGLLLRRAFTIHGPPWRPAALALLAAAVLYVPYTVGKDRLWEAYAAIQREDGAGDALEAAAKVVGEVRDNVTAAYLRDKVLALSSGKAMRPSLTSLEDYVADREAKAREHAEGALPPAGKGAPVGTP